MDRAGPDVYTTGMFERISHFGIVVNDIEQALGTWRDRLGFKQFAEAHFEAGLFGEHVARALEGLPPDFRAVVILSDIEEFSYKEIAEILETKAHEKHLAGLPKYG